MTPAADVHPPSSHSGADNFVRGKEARGAQGAPNGVVMRTDTDGLEGAVTGQVSNTNPCRATHRDSKPTILGITHVTYSFIAKLAASPNPGQCV